MCEPEPKAKAQKNEAMKSLWIHRQLGWSHSRIASLGLCFFAVLLIPKAVLSQTSEKVVIASCYDGDTCTSSTGEKIRLACIDTPELRGKRAEPVPAKAARDHIRELVVGRKVTIRRITTDRYGRTVAELFVNGSNVQQQLVASGYASIYWRYADQCPWIRREKTYTHHTQSVKGSTEQARSQRPCPTFVQPLKTTQIN